MATDLLIVLATNVGSIGAAVVYLSKRVTRLENKINNGLAENVARLDERVGLMWDVCGKVNRSKV